MFPGLDLIDGALLLSAVALSGRIAWLDFRTGSFPLRLWGGLTAIGLGWCLKQRFWPMALIPLALAVLVLWGLNRFGKKRIGEGDLLLLLTTGLFIPLCELDRFFVIAGVMGIALGLFVQIYPRRLRDIPQGAFPFSGALLAAMILTFVIAFR